jgi:hypothetical protein
MCSSVFERIDSKSFKNFCSDAFGSMLPFGERPMGLCGRIGAWEGAGLWSPISSFKGRALHICLFGVKWKWARKSE